MKLDEDVDVRDLSLSSGLPFRLRPFLDGQHGDARVDGQGPGALHSRADPSLVSGNFLCLLRFIYRLLFLILFLLASAEDAEKDTVQTRHWSCRRSNELL